MENSLTGRILVEYVLCRPCANNSGSTSENTTAHQETQTPFEFAINAQGHEHVNGDHGKVDVGDGGDSTDKVGVVDTFPVVTLCLLCRVPESIDRAALEPNEEGLRDIDNNVDNSDGDETTADLRVC